MLCRVMKTARSTYYAWVAGIEAREARRRADEALAHEITVIHLASKGTYGVPRVTADLRRHGHRVNRKRVERVMREHGIAGHSRRTGRRSLTKQDTKAAPAPDLIGRDFHAESPGMKIVGDITYQHRCVYVRERLASPCSKNVTVAWTVSRSAGRAGRRSRSGPGRSRRPGAGRGWVSGGRRSAPGTGRRWRERPGRTRSHRSRHRPAGASCGPAHSTGVPRR
ncbi:IS3 family transposase [Streptomyces sp. H27-H1]|uniref:IS3 family transposase n=1 Tax=Streptomyces sp. H27-H1 TaxID=2996461 RepID=UPI003B641486